MLETLLCVCLCTFMGVNVFTFGSSAGIRWSNFPPYQAWHKRLRIWACQIKKKVTRKDNKDKRDGIIGAKKEVELKKRTQPLWAPVKVLGEGGRQNPVLWKQELACRLLWAVSRSRANIFCFSSKHNQRCSRLRTQGTWLTSTIKTLTTVSFLPVSGTVATSEPQGSGDCCASAVTEKFTFPETHRTELSCARNLAPSQPQDLQSILMSMSRSRACPVFKKTVSMGQKQQWQRAWGPVRRKKLKNLSCIHRFCRESPYGVLTHLKIWELSTRMWCASHWHRGSENLGLLPQGQLWNQESLPAAHSPMSPHGQRNSKDVTVEEKHIVWVEVGERLWSVGVEHTCLKCYICWHRTLA